jgi:hypothetical protein
VQTPEPLEPPRTAPSYEPPETVPRYAGSFWVIGERLTWVSGLVLALSSFTSWYSGTGDGLTLSVTGWHTGVLGKLIFFLGVAIVALVVLRDWAGIELPATVPESLVILALGSLAMIFVLIRLISIPDRFLPASGRSIGICISLLAALAVIVAGLLRAGEEL